jgi:hypothetical protein
MDIFLVVLESVFVYVIRSWGLTHISHEKHQKKIKVNPVTNNYKIRENKNENSLCGI